MEIFTVDNAQNILSLVSIRKWFHLKPFFFFTVASVSTVD